MGSFEKKIRHVVLCSNIVIVWTRENCDWNSLLYKKDQVNEERSNLFKSLSEILENADIVKAYGSRRRSAIILYIPLVLLLSNKLSCDRLLSRASILASDNW